MLSEGQLAMLAGHGEERRAEVGDVLFRVGDRRYPLIAIIEGEAAVLDQTGAEINRHGPGGFLGESSLLTGQTVFFTAVVTEPMRYIAVEREELRALLFEDSALSDLLLWTFIARREGLQARAGVGFEIVGPQSSDATRQLVEFARRNRLPFTWLDTDRPEQAEALAQIPGLADNGIPLVRLPGGPELRNPSAGEVSRALGMGSSSSESETVDLLVGGGGPPAGAACRRAAADTSRSTVSAWSSSSPMPSARNPSPAEDSEAQALPVGARAGSHCSGARRSGRAPPHARGGACPAT